MRLVVADLVVHDHLREPKIEAQKARPLDLRSVGKGTGCARDAQVRNARFYTCRSWLDHPALRNPFVRTLSSDTRAGRLASMEAP